MGDLPGKLLVVLLRKARMVTIHPPLTIHQGIHPVHPIAYLLMELLVADEVLLSREEEAAALSTA